jgi:4-hydroxythreonine-4-phosphate dehydrogenase
MQRPLLALAVGDPAGIGPEIAAAALSDPRVRAAARLVAIGPERLRPDDVRSLGESSPAELAHVEDPAWLDTGGPVRWELGRAQAECGRAALAALWTGARLAQASLVEGLVTAPVSKEALHLAGERVEGQTELLARWAGVERVQMLAVAGPLRVLLLTRHLPLREAIAHLESDSVADHLRMLAGTLRELLGVRQPRLALAGLNPHAGEGGILGVEEREVLAPAAARVRDEGLDVAGPLSPDSVFVRAAAGEFDGVLALYHDQAFIPIKLLGAERAVTVLAGLPYLRVSPAHGTAFDIAGRGVANPENLIVAIEHAAKWARARRAVHA